MTMIFYKLDKRSLHTKLSFLAILLFVASLVACSPQEGKDDRQDVAEHVEQEQDTDDKANENIENEKNTNENDTEEGINRRESKTDMILLEGMEEEFTFTLHVDDALGLSTYIVEDMIAESSSSGEGDHLFVFANFGGTKNEEANVQIFSPSTQSVTTMGELELLAKEQADTNGFKLVERNTDATNRFEWSEKEFDIIKEEKDGSSILGTVSLFKQGGRFYQGTVQYPEEYEEGFMPRAIKMFEDIIWYNEM
jgi:hypothetical protein